MRIRGNAVRLLQSAAALGLLVLIAPFASAAEPEETPAYQNPQMRHVLIERADPGQYLTICPNLCELPDGRLLIAYHRTTRVDFTGEYSTYTRVSRDGGETWGEPRLIDKHMQAPGLLVLPAGELLLNGCTVVNDRWSTTMRLFRSADAGETWREQEPIWRNSNGIRLQGGCASLIRLKSGRILCPMFGSDAVAPDYGGATWAQKAGCYYSDDEAKTWHEGKGKVALPKRGAMEPSVAELSDGTLVM